MICTHCKGKGQIRKWIAQDELGPSETCLDCNGTGVIEEKQQLTDRDLVDPVATFDEVVAAILSERHYQAKVADGQGTGAFRERAAIVPKSVGDYMVMLQAYMNTAYGTWISTPGNEHTLHVIRKIAGIAAKCMEQHGAPKR
jgi:hypothetical protein